MSGHWGTGLPGDLTENGHRTETWVATAAVGDKHGGFREQSRTKETVSVLIEL